MCIRWIIDSYKSFHYLRDNFEGHKAHGGRRLLTSGDGSPKPTLSLQLGFAMVYIDFAPLAVVSISAAQSDT